MKSGFLTLGVALAGLLLAGLVQADSLCPRPLKAGWDPWEPYHYAPQGRELTGSAVEVVREAARRAGCPVEFVPNAWSRTLRAVEQGQLDIAMEVFKTAERQAYAHFSRPYNSAAIYLWVPAGQAASLRFTHLQEMLAQGFRVGVVRGGSFGETADRLLADGEKRGTVEFVRSDDQNLQKLMLKRVDGFLADWDATRRLLDHHPLNSRVEPYPSPLLREDASLMFSRKSVSVAVVQRFDEALDTMNADGSLQRILDRFRTAPPPQLGQKPAASLTEVITTPETQGRAQ